MNTVYKIAMVSNFFHNSTPSHIQDLFFPFYYCCMQSPFTVAPIYVWFFADHWMSVWCDTNAYLDMYYMCVPIYIGTKGWCRASLSLIHYFATLYTKFLSWQAKLASLFRQSLVSNPTRWDYRWTAKSGLPLHGCWGSKFWSTWLCPLRFPSCST